MECTFGFFEEDLRDSWSEEDFLLDDPLSLSVDFLVDDPLSLSVDLLVDESLSVDLRAVDA